MSTIHIGICQNDDLMITQRVLAEFLTLQPNVNLFNIGLTMGLPKQSSQLF